jgi:predicted nucleic acid-binding protein
MRMPRRQVAPIVYLDANAFIDLIEGAPELSGAVKPLFEFLKAKPGLGVTSEISLAEVLAPSSRRGALELHIKRRFYLDLMVFGGFLNLEPVSRDVLYETADLRKVAPMKLVDAIHLATAIRSRCRFLVSRDSDFKRMPTGMQKVLPDASEISRLLEAIA